MAQPQTPGALTDGFLAASQARAIDWPRPADAPAAIDTIEVLFGRGDRPLEVAIAVAANAPKAEDVRRLWKTRANRGAPVLLAVLHSNPATGLQASVIGTEGDAAPVMGLSAGRVERIAATALDEPNRHQAVRALDRLLSSVSRDGLAAGVVNSGLFATHELRDGVPRRHDWQRARERSLPLLARVGRELLGGLGFRIESRGSTLLALADSATNQAIAVVLEESESFDRTSQRFGGVSPVSQALAQAQQERLPWVVALRRNQIRLYPANPDVGVGRKGLTETFVELDLAVLDDSEAAYLALLFSPEALVPKGSVDEIIHHSSVYATELGARLRGRIYEDVVPDLAVAVARRMGAETEGDLESAYHRTLIILFRLLFVAYAEDRDLLPFERNARYTRNALKTYARDFVDDPSMEFSPDSTAIWDDLVQVWNVVDSGDPAWEVPAYNGGLFSTDRVTHPDGAAVSALGLTNAEVGPAVRAMLVDVDVDGVPGPVDFRSLSVREFGTIYEGLLESSLSFAPSDLTLDRQQTYVPAKDGDEVAVKSGDVYFHNASGQRKSTGSYFTKAFAVEHLLDTALEPALSDHLARVAALLAEDDTGQTAAEAFFDFRIADLAMGSGHFLVAAIDRIEARFSAFLALNSLPAIADELQRLDQAARKALGEQGEVAEIEPSLLLRRQIARRCIYGLDINLIAVELARLGIWIHTFVPGLPMSSLDHGLVHANSLTGMATVEEALEALDPESLPGQFSLFSDSIQDALERSRSTLTKVARASEATKQEVREAAEEHRKALAEAQDARVLMDAAVGIRLGLLALPNGPDDAVASIRASSKHAEEIRATLRDLMPAHFPYLFPEVFLRERPGFDAILGNPPWEKVRHEPGPFWAGVSPGLLALPDRQREAKIAQLRLSHLSEAAEEERLASDRAVLQSLFKETFSLRGGTHLELAQLFLERALGLLSRGGRIGMVLPRQMLVLSGWRKLREFLVTTRSTMIVQGMNRGEWLFENVHASYKVVLLSSGPGVPDGSNAVRVWVARSPADVRAVPSTLPLVLEPEDLSTLSDSFVIPWLNDPSERTILDRMRSRPRLCSADGWIRASHDSRWDFTGTGPDGGLVAREEKPGSLKVMMTAHVQPYRIDPEVSVKQFVTIDSLPCDAKGIKRVGYEQLVLDDSHPTVVFRYPSHSDNARTLIATALPFRGWIHNKGYVHAVMQEDGATTLQTLALLGLMNTFVLDWWVRRFVERHVSAPVINNLPLPDWDEAQVQEAARITSELLRRGACLCLPGGTDVPHYAAYAQAPEYELMARLELLAAEGYGLDRADLAVMAGDFSMKGVSEDLRRALRLGDAEGGTA